jgi:hypothetical protein
VKFPLYEATSRGLEIDSFVALGNETMDEDDGPIDYRFDDEAYLKAEYVNPAGKGIQHARSKTVSYHSGF